MRLIPLFGLLVLCACASPARVEQMVAAPTSSLSANSQLRQAMNVGDVTGGQDTNPLWTSEIGNPEFREALRQSLDAIGMLTDANPRYRVDAELVEVDQPFMGIGLTVFTRVNYTVTELANNNVVFQESVYESYEATFGDAVLAVERLRLANEGSIKANITRFLELLTSELDATASLSLS